MCRNRPNGKVTLKAIVHVKSMYAKGKIGFRLITILTDILEAQPFYKSFRNSTIMGAINPGLFFW